MSQIPRPSEIDRGRVFRSDSSDELGWWVNTTVGDETDMRVIDGEVWVYCRTCDQPVMRFDMKALASVLYYVTTHQREHHPARAA